MASPEAHHFTAPLLIGGVMRCCIATLEETLVLETPDEILPCKYCTSSLIFHAGAWQWNHPPLNHYPPIQKWRNK